MTPPPSEVVAPIHDEYVQTFNRKLFYIFVVAALAFIGAGMMFVV
jgi:hypothetical protein